MARAVLFPRSRPSTTAPRARDSSTRGVPRARCGAQCLHFDSPTPAVPELGRQTSPVRPHRVPRTFCDVCFSCVRGVSGVDVGCQAVLERGRVGCRGCRNGAQWRGCEGCSSLGPGSGAASQGSLQCRVVRPVGLSTPHALACYSTLDTWKIFTSLARWYVRVSIACHASDNSVALNCGQAAGLAQAPAPTAPITRLAGRARGARGPGAHPAHGTHPASPPQLRLTARHKLNHPLCQSTAPLLLLLPILTPSPLHRTPSLVTLPVYLLACTFAFRPEPPCDFERGPVLCGSPPCPSDPRRGLLSGPVLRPRPRR